MVWLVILLPATAVVAGLITAVIAFRGADGTVVKDTVRKGLGVHTAQARDARAAQLGLEAKVFGVPRLDADIYVQLRARSALPDEPVLMLDWVHPGKAGLDRHVRLSRVYWSEDRLQAEYTGRVLKAVQAGPNTAWTLVLSSPTWRITQLKELDRVGDVQALPHPLQNNVSNQGIVLRAD